jgi:hypothetical protein
MDEMLKEVDYLVKNFDITSNGKGADKFWNWVRGLKQDGTPLSTAGTPTAANPYLFSIMDELAQTLTYLKKSGLTDDKIINLGGSIGITTKFTDIYVTLQDGTKVYRELKSYMKGAEGLNDAGGEVLSGLLNSPLKTRTAFTTQFIDGYFRRCWSTILTHVCASLSSPLTSVLR